MGDEKVTVYFRRSGVNGSGRVLLVARPWPAWYDTLLRLHEAGYSDRAIGRAVGREASTVQKARKRLELPANTEPGFQPRRDVPPELLAD